MSSTADVLYHRLGYLVPVHSGMAAAGFLVIFAAAVVIVLLEPAREGIGGFIRS